MSDDPSPQSIITGEAVSQRIVRFILSLVLALTLYQEFPSDDL